jgi:CubicO group peptidase (beta-lactamase class C family)
MSLDVRKGAVASRALLLAALALALHAPGSRAQAARGVDPAVLGDYLARAEAFGFSGAVVVAAGDSALVSAGFGLADRVRRIPVTVTSPFYVASLSKQFTAAAVMRLEMAGKLGTRDTLGRFFAGLPPAAARTTLHQLLTHTAGTPRGGGRETDPEAYVRRLFAAPLRAAPGTAYAYSNEGYGVLAAVVQKVSGRSYGAFLREQLFAPAGMGDSYDLADAPPGLTTRAYRGVVDMGDVRLSLGDTVPWDERAGRGIITTAADLWRWERALRGRAILADSAKRKMFTAEREDYGYGWVIARTPRGTRTILHDGLIFPQGWNAQFRRYPDEGVTLIVLSNTFRREPLAQIVAVDLGRLLFGGAVRMPPAVRPAAESERRRMAGSYRLPSGGRLEVREVGGALTIAGEGQDAVNLLQFPNLRDTSALAAQNLRTTRVVRALLADSLAAVRAELADVQDVAAWRAELRTTLDSLAARYGPVRGARVISTAADDTAGTDAHTFVAVRFARDSVVMRYSWRGGKLMGVSNLGSYPRGIREVEQFPGAVPLAPAAAGGWVTYDLATGRARWFRAVLDAAGAVSALEVRGADGAVTATRI